MARHHPFEDEEIARLEWMPLDLRRKLDLAGLHVSLATWQALDLALREAWCDAEVSSAADAAAFAERVRRDCAALSPAPREETPVPADARPWEAPAALERVRERARSLGIDVGAERWAALDERARYALFRLASPRKREEKLRAALELFFGAP